MREGEREGEGGRRGEVKEEVSEGEHGEIYYVYEVHFSISLYTTPFLLHQEKCSTTDRVGE